VRIPTIVNIALGWRSPSTLLGTRPSYHDTLRGADPLRDGGPTPYVELAIVRSVLRANPKLAPVDALMLAARAVRAALQMIEQVKMLNLATGAVRPLSISIGLATGEIVAGHIGTQRRLEYTVIGDAVNLAARLEGLAEPNEILVDERTYEKIRGAVAATRRLVRIKGKSDSSAVYVLHG